MGDAKAVYLFIFEQALYLTFLGGSTLLCLSCHIPVEQLSAERQELHQRAMNFEQRATQLGLELKSAKTSLEETRAALQELGEENQGLQVQMARQQGR